MSETENPELYEAVERARNLLEDVRAGAPEMDEYLRVACARLDDWLSLNAAPFVRDPEAWQAVAAEGRKYR